MKHTMFARQLYQWGPPTAASAVLISTAFGTPAVGWTVSLALTVLMWALLVALAEGSPVSLPWPQARVQLTPVFEFGALLSFGTIPAAAVAGVGRLCASLIQRSSLWEALRNAAQGMLVIGISGAVYFEQGGAFGTALASGHIRFAPLALTVATFALSRAGLLAWKDSMERPSSASAALPGDVPQHVTLGLFVLPLGLGLAWLEGVVGYVAAAYALIPMLLSRGFEREPVTTAARVAVTGDSHLTTVRVLMSAIDAFDPFTRGHSYRISKFAVRVARHLGVQEKEIEEIAYGALLHDIGRTAIELDVLMSPRPLDAKERTVLQTHPTVGYEIVKALPDLGAAAQIVYAHHEQPDGRGYPRGIKGKQIPMGSRIISVAAAFDAMTRERPYRRGLPIPTAYEELRRHGGTQFFPEVVEAFIALHEQGDLDRELDEKQDLPFSPPHSDAPSERVAA